MERAEAMSAARREGGGPNKSEFIRQHPDLSAADLVGKAKEAGIEISPAFVHTVRSRSNLPKNGAAKGRQREPSGHGSENASAFIREQLAKGKSTADIIGEGAKAGFKFSRSLVYAVKASSGSRAQKKDISASDFIRSLPASMSAPEVVKSGAKKGLRFSANLVYRVRSKTPEKSRDSTRKGAARKEAKPVVEPDNEVLFRKLAFEMGLVRARALLDDLEKRLLRLLDRS